MNHVILKALLISFFLVTSATAEVPATTTVPFTLAENLIVVVAEINGVSGSYIVDTGAQVVVLNRPYFESADIDTVVMNHGSPSGANGTISDVQGAINLSLSWDDIKIDGLYGMVTDLTHLEASVGLPIVGLIGFNVLERFQIQFDYAAQELTLYSLGENSKPLLESNIGKPLQVTKFEMMAHIPVFPVAIAGYKLSLGLDSGAGGAILFAQWKEKLEGKYEFIERTEMNGADKNVQLGDVVRFDNIRVQDIRYADMTFRFNDIASHGDNAISMDGLLGYEFLSMRPTAINFRTRELMIWPANEG